MKHLIYLALCLCTIYSCNNETDNIIGFGTPIDFEKDSIVINAHLQELKIRATNNREWWIHSVSDICGDDTIHLRNGYTEINEINVPNKELQGGYFVIRNIDNGVCLGIKVDENTTEEDRELKILLTTGNTFEYFHLKQEAKKEDIEEQ